MNENAPFQRDVFLNKPGIVGARWWQKSVADASNTIARRQALTGCLIAGGLIAGLGTVLTMCGIAVASRSTADDDEVQIQDRASLQMQKEFGWNFGASTENLTFDGESRRPFDPMTLDSMVEDLAPSRADLRPFYVPTLFQSPGAVPKSQPQGDPSTFVLLRSAMKPIFTTAMGLAYLRGRGLSTLFVERDLQAAVVVNLPGPESVAFAAGGAEVFDPVFAFDNWPHPRGVVPAHLTLAASAFYQPLFLRRKGARGENAPALFALDRQRLAAYADAANQFDNRHVARLPSASSLRALGFKRVLYVSPTAANLLELDDLNDDFLLYALGGDVKIIAADAFSPEPSSTDAGSEEGPPHYYGGSKGSHEAFFVDYPWAKPVRTPIAVSASLSPGKNYKPVPRKTAYSSGSATGSVVRPTPPNFGTVPVVIALTTGVILGARMSRSGSWNRASSGSGG